MRKSDCSNAIHPQFEQPLTLLLTLFTYKIFRLFFWLKQVLISKEVGSKINPCGSPIFFHFWAKCSKMTLAVKALSAALEEPPSKLAIFSNSLQILE